MEEILYACCCSEKENVSVAFGVSYDSESKTIIELDAESIDISVAESFWENCSEFESGVEKAKELAKKVSAFSIRQALYEIFGDFSIVYEVDGVEYELDCENDLNKLMYDMLENML